MAAWQFGLFLIPRSKLLQLFSEVPNSINREAFDSTEWWVEQLNTLHLEAEVSSFLDRSHSWSESIKAWGDIDRDYVELFVENGHLLEVGARIDVRAVSKSFLKNICKLATSHDCLLLTENLVIIEPEIELIAQQLRQSVAFSFVTDPINFIERLNSR